MILVDVQVPALDAAYDFSVSKDAQVGVLIEELAEMICQRERLSMPQELSGFSLCSVDGARILPRESTLAECGVKTGNRLILV